MSTLRFISNVQNTNQFSPIYQLNNTIPILNNKMNRNIRSIVGPISIKQSQGVKSLEPIEEKGPKKMSWGEPTWFFFHTLAEKIKESSFNIIRPGFLNIVYNICINLPCPDCASHAKQYMDSKNFNSITSKEMLKKFLFDFHNFVNQRKNFVIMQYSDLDEKYSKANTKNIIYYFINSFEKKNKSIRLLADDIHRQRISASIKEWINDNIGHFDL